MFVRLIPWPKKKFFFELCRNCSVVMLSPQLSNCCANGSNPVNFTFFFLEDNKIVITYSS